MEWWVWVIIAVVVLGLLSKPQKSKSKRGGKRKSTVTSYDIKKEAQKILDGIQTKKQFESLLNRLEKAEERVGELESEAAIQKAEVKIDILQLAADAAESRTYLWQFIPTLEIETPLEHLTKAYKTFTPEQHEEIKGTLGEGKDDWYEIDGYGEPEEPDEDLLAFVKFRKIVESDRTQESKIKSIDNLAESNSIIEDYLGGSDLSPGECWFADQLEQAGLPKARQLYAKGYTTAEKSLEIDPEEFGSWNGVGPKTVESLRTFQANLSETS